MKRTPKKKVRSRGAHGLRVDLANLWLHLKVATDALESAQSRAAELGATDQLALAVKALRTIVSSRETDARSLGIARSTLKKMEVQP